MLIFEYPGEQCERVNKDTQKSILMLNDIAFVKCMVVYHKEEVLNLKRIFAYSKSHLILFLLITVLIFAAVVYILLNRNEIKMPDKAMFVYGMPSYYTYLKI